MIQFHENAKTDRRMEGRMDRPYFIESFWLPPVFQNEEFCKLMF